MRIALSSSVPPSSRARLSLRGAIALWRSRRALAGLSDAQLQDVGLSRQDARAEAERPVWDAPESWKY